MLNYQQYGLVEQLAAAGTVQQGSALFAGVGGLTASANKTASALFAGVGSLTAAGTLVASCTLDPANTDLTDLVLSGGNLVANGKAGASTRGASRCTEGHGSGKYYFETTAITTDSPTGMSVGIMNASQSLASGVGLTGTTTGVGWIPGNGNVTSNNVVLSTIQLLASTHVGCVAVDINAGLIWFRTDGGNWNNNASADPASGTLGISYVFTGTIYPGVGLFGNNTNNQWTMNFGNTAFAQAVPSGFFAWGNTQVTAWQGSALLAGVGSLTANSTQLQVASALLAGAGSLTASAAKPASALLAGVGGLTASSTQNQAASALLAGIGSLTASANKTALALFVGVGGLTVGEQIQSPAFALLAGAGSLAALATEIQVGSALLAGVGSLSANAMKPGSALFAGIGALTALATEIQVGSALLAGVGSLTANATTQASGTIWQGNALFVGSGTFNVLATELQATSALLAGLASLGVAEMLQSPASAQFAGSGALTVNGLLQSPASALLAGVGSLAAKATELQVASALFAGVGSLTATAAGATVWQGNALFVATGGLVVYQSDNWIPGTGFWNDLGVWVDGDPWLDAGNGLGLYLLEVSSALLAGSGSLVVSEMLQSPISALFAGVGSLTVLSSGTSQIIRASALLAGVGSLAATMTGGSGGPPGGGKSEWLVRARRRGRR